MYGKCGEDIVANMYVLGTEKGVDELRYRFFTSSKYVLVEQMPPTSSITILSSMKRIKAQCPHTVTFPTIKKKMKPVRKH